MLIIGNRNTYKILNLNGPDVQIRVSLFVYVNNVKVPKPWFTEKSTQSILRNSVFKPAARTSVTL